MSEINCDAWNTLLAGHHSPFLKYEFLSALESSKCVGDQSGWQSSHLLIKEKDKIVGALPLYLKYHSYGEYVFDWAWASAYEQHGRHYYPKALSAVPFTPVQGSRLLCTEGVNNSAIQRVLVQALKSLVIQNKLSSAHVLFPTSNESNLLASEDFLIRQSVQFHWHNRNYQNFDEFIKSLTLKRRKNIRRERDSIKGLNIEFRHIKGEESSNEDWQFFYKCYERTYIEHRSTPYLNLEFFLKLKNVMPQNLHLIFAMKENTPIASSLLMIDDQKKHAYGRYWGCTEHIPLLHFETCYYQAIDFCIREKILILEGGAQGEHKMFRGFEPTPLQSAHFIRDLNFKEAIRQFLERESSGIANYLNELEEHKIHKKLVSL